MVSSHLFLLSRLRKWLKPYPETREEEALGQTWGNDKSWFLCQSGSSKGEESPSFGPKLNPNSWAKFLQSRVGFDWNSVEWRGEGGERWRNLSSWWRVSTKAVLFWEMSWKEFHTALLPSHTHVHNLWLYVWALDRKQDVKNSLIMQENGSMATAKAKPMLWKSTYTFTKISLLFCPLSFLSMSLHRGGITDIWGQK